MQSGSGLQTSNVSEIDKCDPRAWCISKDRSIVDQNCCEISGHVPYSGNGNCSLPAASELNSKVLPCEILTTTSWIPWLWPKILNYYKIGPLSLTISYQLTLMFLLGGCSPILWIVGGQPITNHLAVTHGRPTQQMTTRRTTKFRSLSLFPLCHPL